MRLYRLFRSIYSPDDATGAFRFAGRWNKPGVRLLYASSSLSLACLEILVHIRDPHNLPDYSWSWLEVPPTQIIPWQIDSARTAAILESDELSRDQGDEFVQRNQRRGILRRETRHVMEVPSAVIRTESNYLVDPRESAGAWAPSEPFRFDPRLLSPGRR